MEQRIGPVRTLFLYSAATQGGMITNLSLIVDHVDPEEIFPFVASMENKEQSVPLRFTGEQLYLDIQERLSLAGVKKIQKMMRDNQIDLLSCHGYKANFYGFLSKLLNRKLKTITIIHGWVGQSPVLRFYQLLDSLVIRFFDKIIVLQKDQELQLKKLLVPRKKISVVPNGIDADDFYTKVQEAKTPIEIKKGQVVLGACSRLSPEKDIVTIIRAMKFLDNPALKLCVVGSGIERGQLERQANLLGIAEQVEFVGYQSDVAAFYAGFDVFISASLSEGMPNSVLEAMSSMLPVVLSDIPAHRELIGNNESGLLFEAGNPISLASRLDELSDVKLRQRYARDAMHTVTEQFSLQKRIKRLTELYTGRL